MHGDPFSALDLPRSADPEEVRRAYRRLARLYHPDIAPDEQASLDRFHEAQNASKATTGESEVTVEPVEGDWWRFTGFSEPDQIRRSGYAIAGLTFELRDSGECHVTVQRTRCGSLTPVRLRLSH